MSDSWRINVFGEVGFAIRHSRYSWLEGCNSPSGYCEYTNSETRAPYFVFYPGARFLLSDTISIMVRVGYPHFTAGVSAVDRGALERQARHVI